MPISITVLNTAHYNAIVDTGNFLLAGPTVFANELNWPLEMSSRLVLARWCVVLLVCCSDNVQWEIPSLLEDPIAA
jgi:hypothetical protein